MSKASAAKCTIAICDGFNLLLPDNLIIDVISAIGIRSSENQNPWVMGELGWRGNPLPIVSAEQLILQRAARLRGSHIAVFRGTQDTARMPFYGVPLQAMPHSYELNRPTELVLREDALHFDFCAMKVRVRGVSTLIPDLQAIEHRLLED